MQVWQKGGGSFSSSLTESSLHICTTAFIFATLHITFNMVRLIVWRRATGGSTSRREINGGGLLTFTVFYEYFMLTFIYCTKFFLNERANGPRAILFTYDISLSRAMADSRRREILR